MRWGHATNALVVVLVWGCSGGDTGETPTPPVVDPPPADAGAPEAAPAPFVEAPYPAFPQMLNKKGPVIAAPKFKAITYSSDPNAATLEDMVAKLATSAWWKTTMAEYGVGPATVAPPVRIPATPPALLAANALETSLEAEFAKPGGGAYGAPDPSTIYTLFLPSGTEMGLPAAAGGGVVCKQAFGYHYAYKRANGTRITYSIVGTCGVGHVGLKGLDAVATTMSHEFVEAASDPYSDDHGWYGFDQDHAIWAYLFGQNSTGGEIGDICDFSASFFFKPTGHPYLVQRPWSNVAAANGAVCQDPAAANTVVRKSVPVMKDVVSFKSGASTITTKGVKLAVGATKTIDVILSSDKPTDPWKLTVAATTEQGAPAPPSATLAFSLDKDQGVNGDVLHLTIKLLAVDPHWDAAPFQVVGRLPDGGTASFYVGVVGR